MPYTNVNRDRKFNIPVFILFIIIISMFAYITVFKFSFLPNGYDISSKGFQSITIDSYNLIGSKTETFSLSLSNEDAWKIDQLTHEINSQKAMFWAFYAFGSISIYLLVNFLRKDNIWKAISKSRILIMTIFPITLIIMDIQSIERLLS